MVNAGVMFNFEEFIRQLFVEIERDEDIVQDSRTDARAHANADKLIAKIQSDESAVKFVEESRLNAAMVCIVWHINNEPDNFINHPGYIPCLLANHKYHERTFKMLEHILHPNEVNVLHLAIFNFKDGVTFGQTESFIENGWAWPLPA